METMEQLLDANNEPQRSQRIVQAFIDAFEDMMRNDPDAWRGKFRKMSSTSFAFYRGSAVLFLSDVATLNDTAFLNDQTTRVWVHGDLHAEHFGTNMNDKGGVVFDVNDFDEARVAPFTWDLKRLAASLALICYAKAISDEEIRKVIQACMYSYAQQVEAFGIGAKIHCVSDADSDTSVVPFSVDQAIHNVIKGREAEFAGSLTEFGLTYGNIVRDDYRLFVDAFRNHAFPNL